MSLKHDEAPERLDRWLWHVRVFKTRSAATEACRGGHVKVNGEAAKPAAHLQPSDLVTVTGQGRERLLEVVSLPRRRGGAPQAAEAYIDRSPVPLPRQPVPKREPGTGRPTKRERRQLDRLRRS